LAWNQSELRAGDEGGRKADVESEQSVGARLQFASEKASGKNMDVTWITERVALGGAIWNAQNMQDLTRSGVTHVLNMQLEFDDRPLAAPFGIRVLWNPTDDDFLPKPPELLERGVDFALEAMGDPQARLYIHCAAGVHRAPMMALAVLCAMGWEIEAAMVLIETRRPVVDFADVYVESVRHYLELRGESQPRS
jgi:protein-tyrosine phosphatase